jgi:hypothetical protein
LEGFYNFIKKIHKEQTLAAAVIFFCGEFSPFCEKEKKFKRIFCHKFPSFFLKKEKMIKNRHSCLHYDCLRFYTFIFLASPNVAKYTYVRSPLEQYHKIGRGKKNQKKNLL